MAAKSKNLTYAATARCPCGAGLAYDRTDKGDGLFRGPTAWDCSEILLGTADAGVKHTDLLPFAFYEIKAESKERGSTRPETATA